MTNSESPDSSPMERGFLGFQQAWGEGSAEGAARLAWECFLPCWNMRGGSLQEWVAFSNSDRASKIHYWVTIQNGWWPTEGLRSAGVFYNRHEDKERQTNRRFRLHPAPKLEEVLLLRDGEAGVVFKVRVDGLSDARDGAYVSEINIQLFPLATFQLLES